MAVAKRPAWVDDDLFPFESRFVGIDGHRIHYVDEGSGPTLLFLHGNPTWSFDYSKVIEFLRPEFRCVAVDYPGFGLSVAAPGYRYLPAEHADCQGRRLLRALRRPRAIRGSNPRLAHPVGLIVAYDAQLAARVRELLADDSAVREQTMFGARAFLVADRVAVAASAEGGLMVRVEPAHTEQLLKTTAAQPITVQGRTMQGWVHIDGKHVRSRRRLSAWIAVGTAAATSTLGVTP